MNRKGEPRDNEKLILFLKSETDEICSVQAEDLLLSHALLFRNRIRLADHTIFGDLSFSHAF